MKFHRRILIDSEALGLSIVKIPKVIKLIQRTGRSVHIKTYPDFCCGIVGLVAFFDALSVDSERWDMSDYVSGYNRPHLQRLIQSSEVGNISGFLLHFVAGKVCWISIKTISDMMKLAQTTVDSDTQGVTSQPLDRPINLKCLLERDLNQRQRILNVD